jgi:hypothetical protein
MTFVVGWVGVELRRRVGLMRSNLTGTRAIVLGKFGRDARAHHARRAANQVKARRRP